jgi:CheY-like chemotaxis protein
VTSSTDTERNEIRVAFADSGIGMNEAEIERVFGAFAQGDHAEGGRSHRFGGLGLGLAISRRLIEMHSGRIEAFSAGKGQGSSFTVHLPLAVVDVSSAAGGATDAVGVSAFDSQSPFAPVRRILLVEDHESTRQTLVRLLERRGFEVVPADSVSSALEAAANGRFNLVLSDIGLPDGDGFTLMRQLVELHHLRGIALTGYGMEADVLRSNEAGFIAHITKPISARTLDRALDQAFAVT